MQMFERFPWRLVAGFLALLAAVLPQSGQATVTIPLSVDRMVDVSELVVEGTVLTFSERAGTTDAGPECPAVALAYTDITVFVRQVYKGRLSSRALLVRVLGGRVEDNRILRDTYLPFRRGERVLLFLQMNGTDDFPFVGFHQGILRFRNSAPQRTMPDLDTANSCVDCVSMVVDGRDHLLLGFAPGGFLNTMPASVHASFRVVVGPGENVPAEPFLPAPGVFPPGFELPERIASAASVRREIRRTLRSLGLPARPPALGDPDAPLVNELRPGDPIIRCALPALLSDEAEAFEVVPGGEIDPEIESGPSEETP